MQPLIIYLKKPGNRCNHYIAADTLGLHLSASPACSKSTDTGLGTNLHSVGTNLHSVGTNFSCPNATKSRAGYARKSTQVFLGNT